MAPNRIRELREAKGWTQLDLANACKSKPPIWPNRISEYETGVRVPELATARAIAEALGVSTDDLQLGMPAEATS